MLENLSAVAECRINKGFGIIDFLAEMEEIKPDIFLVNEDGSTPEKTRICAEKGIEYKYMAKYLKGKLTYDELMEQLRISTWQYAKRQRTWNKKYMSFAKLVEVKE